MKLNPRHMPMREAENLGQILQQWRVRNPSLTVAEEMQLLNGAVSSVLRFVVKDEHEKAEKKAEREERKRK